MQLPDVLLPYKDKILATVKSVINITLKPANDLPLWASKVGGKPYLPKDFNYPTDDKGNPLSLLAQFNMADLPDNDKLPKTGILSFFISGFDDQFGRDVDDSFHQNGFRVLYFDKLITNADELWQDFSEVDAKILNYKEHWLPFYGHREFMVNFKLNHREINHKHFDFENILFDGKSFENDILDFDDDLWYEIIEDDRFFTADGHHLLGYAYFIYDDPRADNDGLKEFILLFQFDSDDDCRILWGDCGLANFLIHPDDLAKLDFSRVYYDWGCS